MLLNTEMGLLLDCPDLAVLLAQGIVKALPEDAYRLRLKATQKSADANLPEIEWVVREGDREVSLTTEPATSAWRRLGVWFFSLLPIESQL